MMVVDRGTHTCHPIPMFSFSSDAPAKSRGMYAGVFPVRNHLDLGLAGVLLITCTLTARDAVAVTHGGGRTFQKNPHKGRWLLYHVADMHSARTFPHMHGVWQELCACKRWALVMLSGQGCVLGPLGKKVTGHELPEQFIRATAPSQGQTRRPQGRGYRFE